MIMTDEITQPRHPTLRYKSKTRLRQKSLKWPATCTLKLRQRDFRIERVSFGLVSTDAWTRTAGEAARASWPRRPRQHLAGHAVRRLPELLRERTVVHLLAPRPDDLPERLDVRPLVLFALRRYLRARRCEERRPGALGRRDACQRNE